MFIFGHLLSAIEEQYEINVSPYMLIERDVYQIPFTIGFTAQEYESDEEALSALEELYEEDLSETELREIYGEASTELKMLYCWMKDELNM